MLMNDDIKAALEAILFASGDFVSAAQLSNVLDITTYEVQSVLQEMIEDYKAASRGIQIISEGDKYRLGTKGQYTQIIRAFFKIPQRRLSNAAMETLAIIAYKQPVTKAEIEKIRGVKSEKIIGALLEKDLIAEAGHKDTLGKPVMYITTSNFLKLFDLGSLKDLPDMENN